MRQFVFGFVAAAILAFDPAGASPLPDAGLGVASAEGHIFQVRAKSKARKRQDARPLLRRSARRVGSSGTVNLSPVKPNAPVGSDLSIPRTAPSTPAPLAAPQSQGPYAAPTGVYPVPSRKSGDTFQDRAARCQHSATLYGVPDASRGGYVHNCAM